MPAQKLARLQMPLLCLSGGRSTPAARRSVALLHGLLPNACPAHVPEAGHMGPVTHAPLVNPHLLGFLQTQLNQGTAAALAA